MRRERKTFTALLCAAALPLFIGGQAFAESPAPPPAETVELAPAEAPWEDAALQGLDACAPPAEEELCAEDVTAVPAAEEAAAGMAALERGEAETARDTPVIVTSFLQLQAALRAPEDADITVRGLIEVTGLLRVEGKKTLSGENGTLVRGPLVREGMIGVLPGARLTLRDITIDGNSAAGDAEYAMLFVDGLTYPEAAVLTLGDGCVLENAHMHSSSVFGAAVYAYGPYASVVMEDGSAIRSCTIQGSGGALALSVTAQFDMRGGGITGNSASAYGGAVFLESAGMVMSGGVISGNGASAGGGVAILDTGRGSSTVALSGGALVADNTAREEGGAEAGRGGGIYQGGGAVTMDSPGAAVRGNSAAQEGGGIYVSPSPPSPQAVFSLRAGRIENNSAMSRGGGISCRAGEVEMRGGVIAGNQVLARDGGVFFDRAAGAGPAAGSGALCGGGGISTEAAAELGGMGVLRLLGGEIRGNTAENCYGGGVLCQGSGGPNASSLLDGTAIVDNRAQYGGGIANAGCSSAQGGAVFLMRSGQVEQNAAGLDGGGIYNAETPCFPRPEGPRVQAKFVLEGGSVLNNTAGRLGGGLYNARGGTPGDDRQSSIGRTAFLMSDAALLYDNTAAVGGDDTWNDNGVFALRKTYPPDTQGQPFAGWFSDDPGRRYADSHAPLPVNSDLLTMSEETLARLTDDFSEGAALPAYGLKAVWRNSPGPEPEPEPEPEPGPEPEPEPEPGPGPEPAPTPPPGSGAEPGPAPEAPPDVPTGDPFPLKWLLGLTAAAPGGAILLWRGKRRK